MSELQPAVDFLEGRGFHARTAIVLGPGLGEVGISCVTNFVAPDDAEEPVTVSHPEVVEAANRAARHLAALLLGVIARESVQKGTR